MRVRKLERERGWAFVVAEAILRPTLLSVSRVKIPGRTIESVLKENLNHG